MLLRLGGGQAATIARNKVQKHENAFDDDHSNIWSKNYTAMVHEFTVQCGCDRAYTFLLCSPVLDFRELDKERKVRQGGVKNVILCRLLLWSKQGITD